MGTSAVEIDLNSRLIPIAWTITVALAVAQDLTANQHSPAQLVLFAALLCVAVIPFLWRSARPLRTYAGVLVLLALLAVYFWSALPAWMAHQTWFPDSSGYWAAFITQTPKLVAAFLIMGILALLGYRRQEYFLTSGAHGKLWIGFGVTCALVVGLAAVIYWQAGAGAVKGASAGVRYLPLALVLAAMNSFAEEMLYRGALLGTLLPHVSANQAIAMTAALFGIAHYHGTPSGFPGMGLTFIAGWIFGFAMVETRSILLPWFLHFIPDAVIFVASAQQN